MELRELKHLIVDKICIYTKTDAADEPYRTLFKGKFQDVPEAFLYEVVVLIGVKNKDTLDIEIR